MPITTLPQAPQTALDAPGSRHAHFHWFLPTYGDSRNLMSGGHGTDMAGERTADLHYLKQLAFAMERNKFELVLIPTGLWCEDAWITASTLVDSTSTLGFLIAARPGLISPLLAGQMISTLQKHSGNRVALNVVTGGENAEQKAYGDFVEKDERYKRSGEFLHVLKQLWESPDPVTFHGTHIRVENALLNTTDVALPPIFFAGSSPAAAQVAGQYADTYLTWGEKPAQVLEKKEWIDSIALQAGRSVDHGVRFHVITRDSSAEAWAEAERLLGKLDARDVAKAQEVMRKSASHGQRRMQELHHGAQSFSERARAKDFEIYPHLWAGVGLVRGGAGTALVGSHEEVADLIEQYFAIGMSHFILSGYPHLEEAYHFGEGVRPILQKRGIIASPSEDPISACKKKNVPASL